MAQTERKTLLTDLKIDTPFQGAWSNGDEYAVETIDGDGIEDDRANDPDVGGKSDVLNQLHSSTPPISVPRPEERLGHTTEISFPQRSDNVDASPHTSFLENRHPSIAFCPPNFAHDSNRQVEPATKDDIKNQKPYKLQTRPFSGLKRSLSQNENTEYDNNTKCLDWNSSPRRPLSQKTPTRNLRLLSSPDDTTSTSSELDRLSSMTSASPASTVSEELRTPPESKEVWPPYVSSPGQQVPSLEGRNSWSANQTTPFGSKPRDSPLERIGSFRGSARRNSRRSTASSGKSAASVFLSGWSSREEPPPQPDDEGQMVGTEYIMGKQIGYGGFSTIKEAFKAEENGEMRRLAVKVVKKQVPGKSEVENDQVQAEFDHEVRVWRYLNNPHILTLDSVYDTDYATFCFTKFAIGGSLFDLVRQNRRGLDTRLAKKYTYQLACALRYLHEDARIVHRDIKLENCLLDPVDTSDNTGAYNLLLCDFGMAEWMTTDNDSSSPEPYGNESDRPPPKCIGPAESSTSIAGSLEYASPELLLSTNGVINPAVDMWAFGVVVFSLVVGSRPFQDPFTPRVKSNIINGHWKRELVLDEGNGSRNLRDREDALELISGCLDLDVERRWTIRDVLASSWLCGYPDCSGEKEADAAWSYGDY